MMSSQSPSPLRLTQKIQLLEQLYLLLDAELPLLEALLVLKTLQTSPNGRAVVERLIQSARQGRGLTGGFKRLAAVFEPHEAAVIEAGERSGALPCVLKDLGEQLKQTQQATQQWINAMAYPVGVLMVAAAVTSGLLIWVVPQFGAMFQDFEMPLPMATVAIVRTADVFRAHGWSMALGVLALAGIMVGGHSRSIAMQRSVRYLLGLLPGLVGLIEQRSWGAIAHGLSTLLGAGIPMPKALSLTAQTVHWPPHRQAMIAAHRSVGRGLSLSQALSLTQACPDLLIQLTAVGERAGNTAPMLFKGALFLREDVNFRVDRFSKLAEPFMMVAVGLMVGGLLIALYLPIFNMAQITM